EDLQMSSHPGKTHVNEDGFVDRVDVKNADGSQDSYYDDDHDGRIDWVAHTRVDGTATLLLDNNHDGKPDRQIEVGPDGLPVYSGPLDDHGSGVGPVSSSSKAQTPDESGAGARSADSASALASW